MSRIGHGQVSQLRSMMSTWTSWVGKIRNKKHFRLWSFGGITISRGIAPEGLIFVSKPWKCVPNQLAELQFQHRAEAAVSLLFFRSTRTRLSSIVNRDEKWVLYSNVQCKRSCCPPGEHPKTTGKPGLHPKRPCCQFGGRQGICCLKSHH